MAAHRRRWSDRAGNAWTNTPVNSRVIVIGDPVRQEPFQMPLLKWDQEIPALPSDRPYQPLTEGIRIGHQTRGMCRWKLSNDAAHPLGEYRCPMLVRLPRNARVEAVAPQLEEMRIAFNLFLA